MTKNHTDPRESFTVSFIIEGPHLDLEDITRGIKIEPSYTHHAGDLSKIKTRFRSDMWCLTSPLNPKSEPFDAHLKWLVEQLKPSYDFIRSLKKSAEEVYIRLGYVTEAEQSGFTLSAAAVSILTDLDISMDVSILSI